MSRISGELIAELEKECGISKRSIYRRVDKRWKLAGKSFSKKIAALSLAAEVDIDPQKYANKEELEELRDLQGRIGSTSTRSGQTPSRRFQAKKRTSTVHQLSFDDITKELPTNLGASKIRESFDMAQVYCYLYILENSIRQFIIDVMKKSHGKDWWKDCVNVKIRENVAKRMKKDKENPWHGSRKAHSIYYADVDDYRSIISRNSNVFKAYLPNLKSPIQWVQNRMEEITFSRNIIAHMNPLAKKDRDRLKIYVSDWLEQIG